MARFGGSGIEIQGELAAMMLDAKRTFDELIGRLAPTPAKRDEILANPVYEHISTAVAGSQEYTAIAKLYELEHSGDHDVIVLDTPPSRHAIDFLDAPDRLIGFLEGRTLAAFMRPTGHAIHAAGVAFAVLRRITGTGLLDDLNSFFRLLSELLDGFRRRAVDVHELLTDPASAFVIVTSPERTELEEALFFAAELDRLGMHRAAVIVNRVHPFDLTNLDVARTVARLTPVLGSSLAQRAARTHAQVQRLALRDAAAIARLRSALHAEPVSLGDRPSGVHDIPGVVALYEELFERDDADGTHRQIPPVLCATARIVAGNTDRLPMTMPRDQPRSSPPTSAPFLPCGSRRASTVIRKAAMRRHSVRCWHK